MSFECRCGGVFWCHPPVCLHSIKTSRIRASIAHTSPNPAWTRSCCTCRWPRWSPASTPASPPPRWPAAGSAPVSCRQFCVASTSCWRHGTHSWCRRPSILAACAKCSSSRRSGPVSLRANWSWAALRDLRHLATGYKYAFRGDAAEPRRCPAVEQWKLFSSFCRLLLLRVVGIRAPLEWLVGSLPMGNSLRPTPWPPWRPRHCRRRPFARATRISRAAMPRARTRSHAASTTNRSRRWILCWAHRTAPFRIVAAPFSRTRRDTSMSVSTTKRWRMSCRTRWPRLWRAVSTCCCCWGGCGWKRERERDGLTIVFPVPGGPTISTPFHGRRIPWNVQVSPGDIRICEWGKWFSAERNSLWNSRASTWAAQRPLPASASLRSGRQCRPSGYLDSFGEYHVLWKCKSCLSNQPFFSRQSKRAYNYPEYQLDRLPCDCSPQTSFLHRPALLPSVHHLSPD